MPYNFTSRSAGATVGLTVATVTGASADEDGIQIANCSTGARLFVNVTDSVTGTIADPSSTDYDYKIGPGETLPIQVRGDVKILADTAATPYSARRFRWSRAQGDS